MKKYFTQIMFALVVLAGTMLLSCSKEGPAGPAGSNGINGNATCGTCHSSTATDFNIKVADYEVSKHGTGIVFEEEAGRSTSCAGCHSGAGFIDACQNNSNDAKYGGSGAINCFTCHKLHTKYDMSDFALMWNTAITFRQPATPVTTFDFKGAGNLCAKCHQARVINRVYNADKSKDSIARNTGGYTRLGPHYGMAANIVTGFGIEPMAGLTIPAATDNPHAGLSKGCVSCHMATDTTTSGSGGHTFKMVLANFAKIKDAEWALAGGSGGCMCHPKSQITTGATTKAITADIAKIRRKIVDAGLLDTTQAVTAEGYLTIAEYIAANKTTYKLIGKDTVSALINYLYVAKDRSNGAHNPTLMKNMVATLKNFFGVAK